MPFGRAFRYAQAFADLFMGKVFIDVQVKNGGGGSGQLVDELLNLFGRYVARYAGIRACLRKGVPDVNFIREPGFFLDKVNAGMYHNGPDPGPQFIFMPVLAQGLENPEQGIVVNGTGPVHITGIAVTDPDHIRIK